MKKGRLEGILSSWAEHNKEHSERLRKWADKTESAESNPIYHRALETTEELEKSNKQLFQVLGELKVG